MLVEIVENNNEMHFVKLVQQEREAKARSILTGNDENPDDNNTPSNVFLLRRSRELTVVPDTRGEVTYEADILTPEGIAWVLRKLEGEKNGWVHLKNRSLLNLGGTPYFDGLITEPLPTWFRELLSGLGDYGDEMNQALINRYQNGKGISPHMDGPLYAPKAVILSLTGSAFLHFYDDSKGKREPSSTYLLEPNSILSFTGDFYDKMKHGIASVGEDKDWVESLQSPPDDHGERLEFANKTLLRDPSIRSVSRKDDRISITVRRVAKESPLATRTLSPDYHKERLRAAAWWRRAVDDADA